MRSLNRRKDACDEGAAISEGIRESFWLQGMQAGIKAAYDCIKPFFEVDFAEDLKRFNRPTLIARGADDQIVPIGASAMRSSKLVANATLKVYPGGAARTCPDTAGCIQRRPAGLHRRLSRQSPGASERRSEWSHRGRPLPTY